MFGLTQGQRRHLNIILEDRVKTNREDAANGGVHMKGNDHTLNFSAEALEEMAKKLESQVVDYDPPYLKRDGAAAELATSVSSSRNPSGAFHQSANPSLWEERTPIEVRVPTENLTTLAYDTMGLHHWKPNPKGGAASEAKEAASSEVDGSSSNLPGAQTLSWLLPYETGNAALGKKLAGNVNSRRTPNGGFYQT